MLLGGALSLGLYLAGETLDSSTLTEHGISYASPLHAAGSVLSFEILELTELYGPGSFVAALVIGVYLGVKTASLFPKAPAAV